MYFPSVGTSIHFDAQVTLNVSVKFTPFTVFDGGIVKN